MDSLYRENILDHYKHPRNFGPLTNPDVSHEENNPFCGDRIVMGVKFQISKFKFQIHKMEEDVLNLLSQSDDFDDDANVVDEEEGEEEPEVVEETDEEVDGDEAETDDVTTEEE